MLSTVKVMFRLNLLMFVVGLVLSDNFLMVAGIVNINIWHVAELILRSHIAMREDFTRRVR